LAGGCNGKIAGKHYDRYKQNDQDPWHTLVVHLFFSCCDCEGHTTLLFYDVPFPMVGIHLRLNEVHWILFLDDARGNPIVYERGGMSANHRAPTCAPNYLLD
jgi:hypothetical protein